MFSPDLGNRIIIFFLINIVATSFDIIITSSRVVPLLKVLEKKNIFVQIWRFFHAFTSIQEID